MDCVATCLGKAGTTFNMVVFDDPYLFKGGSSLTVHEYVGRVLEKARDDFGKLLFKVEYLEELVTEPDIEIDIIPDKVTSKKDKPE